MAPEPGAPAPPTRGARRSPSLLCGWRVPVRLAQRDLRRRPGRTVLVALLVAVPVTALVLADVTYRTSQAEEGAWIPQVFGPADAVATLAADPDMSNCPECAGRADVEPALPEGTRQLWLTQAGIPLRTPEQRVGQGVTVSNTDVTDPLYVGSYSLAQGEWPSTDDEVALQSELADFLGVTVGDDFSLAHQTRRFEVVGLIEWGGRQSAVCSWHRPRAAAVLALLLVAGVAAAGVAAAVEHRIQGNEAAAAAVLTRSDLVWVQSSSQLLVTDSSWSTTPLALIDVPTVHSDAEKAIGPATWTSAALAYQPNRTNPAEANLFSVVATDEVLDLFGLSAPHRQAIADANGPVLVTLTQYSTDRSFAEVVAPELQLNLPWPLISPAAAAGDDWTVVLEAIEFGVAGHDVTPKEQVALLMLSTDNSEGLAYLGMDASGGSTTWSLATYTYGDEGSS